MPSPKSPTAVVVIAARAERGWSQSDLAEVLAEANPETPWSRSRVRRLEAGELVVNIDVLQTLSEVLDLDYATLIEGYGRQGVTPRYTMDGETAGQTVDAQDSSLAMAA